MLVHKEASKESSLEGEDNSPKRKSDRIRDIGNISQDENNLNTTTVDAGGDINQTSNIHSRFIEDLLSDNE